MASVQRAESGTLPLITDGDRAVGFDRLAPARVARRSAIAADLWIDIDNPPQVQYLLPLKAAFERAGARVVVTARDYGVTLELLEASGTDFVPVGESFGARKWNKARGMWRRAATLVKLLRAQGAPAGLICASRTSALAARRLRIPSFIIGDYEWANVSVYRLTRSILLYPDVVDPAAFTSRGIRPSRLIPFRGLKEDLTFADVDFDQPAYEFAELGPQRNLVRVLFRPPAEESHYYRDESLDLALELLDELARRPGLVVVFSPRYPRQVAYLERVRWKTPPLVLDRPVPFMPLLKGVDAVVSSGGTMLREAAYLGVPAYSIFRSKIGAVDRHLAAIGRMRLLTDPGEFSALRFERRRPLSILRTNPRLMDELADLILERTRAQEERAAA
jgi:predicted glycosyltransferase